MTETSFPPAAVTSTSTAHLPQEENQAQRRRKTPKPTYSQPNVYEYDRRLMSILKKPQTDLLVLRMIVEDLQPFSIIEDGGFRKFVNHLEPSYTLPCRTTLSRQHLASKFADVETAIDIWTSRTTQAYIAVTEHFIDPNWTLKKIMLGCICVTVSHTAVLIRNEILKVCL